MIKKKNLFDKKKEVSIPDKQGKEELKKLYLAQIKIIGLKENNAEIKARVGNSSFFRDYMIYRGKKFGYLSPSQAYSRTHALWDKTGITAIGAN